MVDVIVGNENNYFFHLFWKQISDWSTKVLFLSKVEQWFLDALRKNDERSMGN